ncbi:MAG: alpha-glucan family phosphorylase [Pyramidobacter sp.]|jgi:phosphorylase/glycogen(starch) synthase
MNSNLQRAPAALFEVSWEVCNKVGGIYTVVSTKAEEAARHFGENYFLLGPLRKKNPGFEECLPGSPDDLTWQNFRRAASVHRLKCRFGRWLIPGRPKVILIDWEGRYNQNQLLYDLWQNYGVDSLTGGWDYVEPVMFSSACGEAIAAFSKVLAGDGDSPLCTAAHFHEWMCGAGLLALKRIDPSIATTFTTHATVLGRAMAGSGRDIYAEMDQINPAEEARRYNVAAKCSMESAAAREADCFTTVSAITADEAAAFLGRRPDLVTPNGLSLSAIPDYSENRSEPQKNRKKILAAAERLLRRHLPDSTRILLISGRYEFHNKGIDLFLDALAQLNRSRGADRPPILALLAVMNGHRGIDAEALSDNSPSEEQKGGRLTAHQIYDGANDAILSACRRLGLDNRRENSVQVILDPAELDGSDGLFNLDYISVLCACDGGVFPSWYEPWGYTPQEAAACAVPTVTSDLAGFGRWVTGCGADLKGINVLGRSHQPYDNIVKKLAEALDHLTELSDEALLPLRKAARETASKTDWNSFYEFYENAYELAARNAAARTSTRPVANVNDAKMPRVFSGRASVTPLLRGFTSIVKLPEKLSRLQELAHNLWWTWHPQYVPLFRDIDAGLWERFGHNAVAVIENASRSRLLELADDPSYRALYDSAVAALDAEMEAPFDDTIADLTPKSPVAYFSTEYGIHESLPIYSGGLGILSGDHLKSASDLRLPLVAVGLLYKCGYFKQKISSDGRQLALYPESQFRTLPISRVKDKQTREHLHISLSLPGRTLYARVWRAQVGRIPLYLLDTDTPKNTEEDRRITERLYVADRDARIRQEILLGMGGPKTLAALDIHPHVYHMNEGHSAFMILERIRHLCLTRGLSFEAAREAVRGDSIFTTHTPVDAGNERFSAELMHRYFDDWCQQLGVGWNDLMKLGCRSNQSTDFEMTLLALNHAMRRNGVSKLHGGVSRAMWQFNWKGLSAEEIPIGAITNGVHPATFTGTPVAHTLAQTVGSDWMFLPPDAPQWEKVTQIPDSQLWQAHQEQKENLMALLKKTSPRNFQKAAESWRVPPLVIGFARRFAPYKRADLLLADTKRLTRLLSEPDRPAIVIFSGKAHPADGQGCELIHRVIKASQTPELAGRIFFIPNYNLDIARCMVQGCDVWLNTPRRPYEASGTSGQKAAPNGTLNLSVSDGWWCEGDNGENGWTIGPRVTTLHDAPADQSDYADADSLYTLLENEILPLYFSRSSDGLPHGWIQRMKNSIATLTPQFNSARMVRQYTLECYSPAAERHTKMRAENRLLPRRLSQWKASAGARFSGVGISQIEVQGLKQNHIPCTEPLTVSAWVRPGAMKPEELQIQFVAGRSEGREFVEKPDVTVLTLQGTDKDGQLIYRGTYTPQYNGHYLYGIRALPYSPDLDDLFDTRLIQWG